MKIPVKINLKQPLNWRGSVDGVADGARKLIKSTTYTFIIYTFLIL